MTEMILTSEIIGTVEIPPELKDMLIFDLDVEEVTVAHLQGFYYRAKLRTSHTTAKYFAEMIAREITNANKIGAVDNNRLSNFFLKTQPMLSSELRQSLEKMELSERRCTYFALLLNVDVDNVVNLKWDEIRELHKLNAINDAATDVLDSLPRHFKFPFVFWKNNPPERLHDIKQTVELAFGCTYETLRKKFLTMVLVDTDQQVEDFKKNLGGVYE